MTDLNAVTADGGAGTLSGNAGPAGADDSLPGDPRLTGAIHVCGTASDVGKSTLVVGICRLLAREGVLVAPFKSQNMALNSWVTLDGAEIGRAQAVQAIACGIEPEAVMNPILLKPTGERSSQVVLLGRPWDTLDAVSYHKAKPQLEKVVLDSLADLRSRFDVVVCEGAGSPAEINLLDNDIVNLRLARMAGIPAVIVGDIDRGGVFAALYGTVELLPKELREMVKGFIINKFRGDESLLGPALEEISARTNVPFFGVVPHVSGVDIDAEDSLGIPGQDPASEGVSDQKLLEVCVIRLPRMSNFTDFDPLQLEPGVNVRFVSRGEQLSDADLIVLPGSKSTVEDLDWLRTNGISETLLKLLGQPDGPLLLGVCGGYQILGVRIVDGIESNSPEVDGLGLLPVETVFHPEKTTRRRSGSALGMVSPELIGADISGYEIRHGDPQPVAGAVAASDGAAGPWISLSDRYGTVDEGWAEPEAGVFGTSLHGLFENDGVRMAILTMAAARRGKRFDDSGMRFGALRQRRLDRLADAVEGALDMEGLKSVISSARSADGGGR